MRQPDSISSRQLMRTFSLFLCRIFRLTLLRLVDQLKQCYSNELGKKREKERTFFQKFFPSRICFLHNRLKQHYENQDLWKKNMLRKELLNTFLSIPDFLAIHQLNPSVLLFFLRINCFFFRKLRYHKLWYYCCR